VRFLANENFPGNAIEALRKQGHDVRWIRTDAPGSSDSEVLSMAQAEDRILLTFDRDFGELAFRLGLPAATGIVLFGFRMTSAQQVASVVTQAISLRTD